MTHTLAIKILAILWLAFTLAGCSSDTAEAEGGPAGAALLELEGFLTNINDDETERYCKVGLKLAITPEAKVVQIQENPVLLARLRDEVLSILAAKSFAELREPSGMQALREEIRTRLTELLPGADIQQVLFSEFIVQ